MERPEIKHCFGELIYFPEIFIMLSFRSSGIAYRSAEESYKVFLVVILELILVQKIKIS